MSEDGWEDFFGEKDVAKEKAEKSQAVEPALTTETQSVAESKPQPEPQPQVAEKVPEQEAPSLPVKQEEQSDFSYTNQAPSIIGEISSPSFASLVAKVRDQYCRLPRLNYADVYSELADLTVPACPTPTLQVINQELQKSQAAKDRVTELDIQMTQCVMLKDRAVDILKEAWNKFSDEKSADKRKGEALHILANFEMDLAKTESLAKACKYVMMNLVSLQDTLSRRITNIQLQIKLMDIGRSALPDFDFSKKSMDIQIDSQDNSLSPEVREDGTIPARESEF